MSRLSVKNQRAARADRNLGSVPNWHGIHRRCGRRGSLCDSCSRTLLKHFSILFQPGYSTHASSAQFNVDDPSRPILVIVPYATLAGYSPAELKHNSFVKFSAASATGQRQLLGFRHDGPLYGSIIPIRGRLSMTMWGSRPIAPAGSQGGPLAGLRGDARFCARRWGLDRCGL